MTRACSGFTLIELLVVIAIIAILNAIVAPAFTTAMDRAQLDRCQTHLREVGLATKMYFEEHGEYPPLLQNLYNGHYADDDSVLLCSKTGKRFHYQHPQPGADRKQTFISCVPTSTPRGKRPHFFDDAFALARVSGKVEVQRHEQVSESLAQELYSELAEQLRTSTGLGVQLLSQRCQVVVSPRHRGRSRPTVTADARVRPSPRQ